MRWIIALYSALVVGALAIVMAISFASIVHTGPLAMYLDRGIGTTLLSAAISAGLSAFLFWFRGIVSHSQVLTAILLSASAASIAARLGPSEGLFATIFLLLAVAAAVTGVSMVVLGVLRLSFIVRFIPYPVMGGFLAATGYLLLMGGVGRLLGENVTLWSLPGALSMGAMGEWVPWIAVAGGAWPPPALCRASTRCRPASR